jgi:hypothetical protein
MAGWRKSLYRPFIMTMTGVNILHFLVSRAAGYIEKTKNIKKVNLDGLNQFFLQLR